MKVITVTVFALTAATVSAQPILMPREYYYAVVPRAVTDLEARWHFSFPKIKFPKINLPKINLPKINWHNIGNIVNTAANIGQSILSKRMDEDELYARKFIDEEDLVSRDSDGKYFEARDFDHDYLEQRDLDILELRDEQDDRDRPLAHQSHRLTRYGANHNKVGKYGKLWAAQETAPRVAAARRSSRPVGHLDDLN